KEIHHTEEGAEVFSPQTSVHLEEEAGKEARNTTRRGRRAKVCGKETHVEETLRQKDSSEERGERSADACRRNVRRRKLEGRRRRPGSIEGILRGTRRRAARARGGRRDGGGGGKASQAVGGIRGGYGVVR